MSPLSFINIKLVFLDDCVDFKAFSSEKNIYKYFFEIIVNNRTLNELELQSIRCFYTYPFVVLKDRNLVHTLVIIFQSNIYKYFSYSKDSKVCSIIENKINYILVRDSRDMQSFYRKIFISHYK